MPRVVVYAKERRLLTTFEQLLFIFFFVCVRAYRLNPSVQAHHLLRRRVTVLLTCILCARARRKRKRVRTEIPNCHEAVLADEYTHLLCFRFSRGEVLEILSALQIPEVFRTPCRHVFTGEKALYALLAKLSHLGTPALLLPALGFQREEQISLAYLVILYHLRPLLERVTDMRNCTPYFKRSAQVLEGRGCPHGCFALLDGKIFQISKQEGFYSEFQSGHKFVCGVTYLGITLANGLLAGFQGPIIGSRHDSFVFSETDTYTRLQQAREKLRSELAAEGVPQEDFDVNELHVLADSAFPCSDLVLPVFKQARGNPALTAANATLSHSRICVEMVFGAMVETFKGVEGKYVQLRKSPIILLHQCTALLHNLRCCLHGSPTESWDPSPSLADYVQTVLLPQDET